MRNWVLLFIFIFSPLAFNVSGSIGKTEIAKSKLLVFEKPVIKTIEEEISQAFSDWNIAEATYYDPKDTAQTKKCPDGIGTFERMVGKGSIALGSSFTEVIREKKLEIFIEVMNLDVMTPYGKGIFRVDDAVPGDYEKIKKVHIDFYHEDLNPTYKRIGRFDVKFRVIKIQTARLS